MAHRIVCDISEDLRQLLSMGRSGPFVDDWKRTNAYAVRYQDENVILNAQVQRLTANNAELMKQIMFARGNLYAAMVQLAPSDDRIISEHIRIAHDALSAAIAKATGESCT